MQAGGEAIKEAFGPADAEPNNDIYHYKNQDGTPGEFKGWETCGHYARFISKDESASPDITVKMSYQDADTWADEHWSSWEVTFRPIKCGAGKYCDQTAGGLPHPEEMSSEMKQRLGIKRVNPNDYATAEDVPKINGKTPEYIATNFPMEVTNVRRTEEWRDKE